jgi:peroxiredoxin
VGRAFGRGPCAFWAYSPSGMNDYRGLPPDLPVPEDDGATDHLAGLDLPAVRLEATIGDPVDLAAAARAAGTLVVYVYPRTGTPGRPLPAGWDAIPGARGCTPESCSFRDHAGELAALGAQVHGLSAQPLAEQREFAQREHMPFALLNDAGLLLADALRLPTFEVDGMTLYKRLTLIARGGRIDRVFYPVFPPDTHVGDVLAELGAERLREP